MNFIEKLFEKDKYESDFSHAGHCFFLGVMTACALAAGWAIIRVFLH